MVAPIHDGLFTTEPPALLGARCDACGRPHFPRLAQCPYCGSEDVVAVALSDRGTLWGWTEVTAPPPGYAGSVPFGFGVVELPEGLRVITRLASPVDGYRFGQAMRLRLVTLPGDVTEGAGGDPVLTWEFAPDAEEAAS